MESRITETTTNIMTIQEELVQTRCLLASQLSFISNNPSRMASRIENNDFQLTIYPKDNLYNVENMIPSGSHRSPLYSSESSIDVLSSQSTTPIPSIFYQPMNDAAFNRLQDLNQTLYKDWLKIIAAVIFLKIFSMSKQLVYSFAKVFTFDIIQTSIDKVFSEEIVETAVDDTTMEIYAAKFIENLNFI